MSDKSLKNNSTMFIVLGDDTYIGSKMMKFLTEKHQYVHGFSQNEYFKFNDNSNATDNDTTETRHIEESWIVICLDPSMGFEQYVEKMKKICDGLDEMDYAGHICYFSSASICQSEYDKAISEESLVFPRNERDLCYATGENLLHILISSEKSYVEPHIFRVGVPYGDETPSFIKDMIKIAKNDNEIKVPFGSEAKRTLTHIDDICETSIELMNLKFCPQLVNVAGETKTINEVGKAVADKYNVEFVERGLSNHNSEDFYAGDQELSAELFNESITFTPKYTFNKWLNEQ